MAVALLAEITNLGRQRFADMTVSGRSFIIEQFVTGEGGHDPGNPTIPLTPDVSVSSLPLETFGPKAITSGVNVVFIDTITCTLGPTEANGVLSNVGLLARINYSPLIGDPLLNTYFLFAIANMPMQNKLAGETKIFEVVINY